MAEPLPSLSLSDIMHPFSPPPVANPQKPTSPPPRPRSNTPEPLEPADIEEMRRKVLNMGWGDSLKGKEKAGSREQELADMLLRLTHPASLPQPSQLHAQAETIAHLIQQRDFLVKRSIEEQERWESEKEGWARAAQALIIQGRRDISQAEKDESQYSLAPDTSSRRMQELERANAALQNDKKMLQQKLTDTQNRLASLESELAQLKPLLLMQPYALTHSHPTGTQFGWSAALPTPSTPATARRERADRRVQDQDAEGEEENDSDEELSLPQLQPRPQLRNSALRPTTQDQTSLLPASPQKPKGDYYRRRDINSSTAHYPSPQNFKTGRRKPQGPVKPVLSDARAEHLLLAARKIGRQRASVLSGAFAHLQQAPDTSTGRSKRPMSPSKGPPQPPKTPRRNANASTPLLTRTPLGQGGMSPGQPRTPLQSLLSAAQSVLSGSGAASSSTSMPESPLAKRRKIDHVTIIQSTDTPSTAKKEREKDKDNRERSSAPGGVSRVKSALDFLADQAEVYSTQPASQESVGDADSEPRDKDDASQPDVEMEDASQPVPNEAPGDVAKHPVHDVKGKEKAMEPTSTSRAATPPPEPVEEEHTQQTSIGYRSRGTTPSATIGMLSDSPSGIRHGDSSPPNSGSGHDNNRRSSQTSLAPPIDLTSRSSRSPAPPLTSGSKSSNARPSRSPSAEGFPSRAPSVQASDNPNPSGSFSMFSLRRPQPLTIAPGGPPTVLYPSSVTEASEQEQGPSMGISARIEGIKFVSTEGPPRRTRSPYIKWTKEEDDLLAKAVAKHGQKWDLVQKELPSRGYHQVRQRWLRKLGVLESNKLDLSSLETNAAAEFLNIATAPPNEEELVTPPESTTTANPKLGLAPLNSDQSITTPSGDPSTSPKVEANGGGTIGPDGGGEGG